MICFFEWRCLEHCVCLTSVNTFIHFYYTFDCCSFSAISNDNFTVCLLYRHEAAAAAVVIVIAIIFLSCKFISRRWRCSMLCQFRFSFIVFRISQWANVCLYFHCAGFYSDIFPFAQWYQPAEGIDNGRLFEHSCRNLVQIFVSFVFLSSFFLDFCCCFHFKQTLTLFSICFVEC